MNTVLNSIAQCHMISRAPTLHACTPASSRINPGARMPESSHHHACVSIAPQTPKTEWVHARTSTSWQLMSPIRTLARLHRHASIAATTCINHSMTSPVLPCHYINVWTSYCFVPIHLACPCTSACRHCRAFFFAPVCMSHSILFRRPPNKLKPLRRRTHAKLYRTTPSLAVLHDFTNLHARAPSSACVHPCHHMRDPSRHVTSASTPLTQNGTRA